MTILPESSGRLCAWRPSRTGSDSMIVAEFTLDHPILRGALADRRDVHVTWEDSYVTPADEMQMLAWFESDDFDALDAAVEADDSVANRERVATVRGRRLYRFDVVNAAREHSIMPVLVSNGAKALEIEASHEGWWNSVRFPDRESFQTVYRHCRANDVAFTVHRVVDDDPFRSTAGVTDPQREVLVHAMEAGYLDVPRSASLADLAGELDISESAASERFRRGVRAVLERTLAR